MAWKGLICTSIIQKGPQSVSLIERLSSLRRLKCTSKTEKGPRSVSVIERFFVLFQSVHYWRSYCRYTAKSTQWSMELIICYDRL